ncbi:diguanylate cyclase [Janthinobacterium rivuli]|uniref:GGDEF domain-containing protein n=1 Tax=Janthinobacterium sp. FT68W TaxID=2654255 RepID=UPI0012651816|nr:GGDEF domain-containing protein [Janthinobacterium sp. FT68W]KAB8047279.1 diguanylate cyclase [Janthinobacterium sp. FT68W]
MKLEKLRFLSVEIKKEIGNDIVAFLIYYKFNKIWNILDDVRQISPAEILSLEKAQSESIAYHATSDRASWFSLPELDCVVMALFSSSPRIATRKAIKERISISIEHAANAFKVTHNSLTLLLGKEAFELQLSKSIEQFSNPLGLHTEGQESSPPTNLAVIAMDIDYFKQVNDTYGHLYGDQVLKTFGVRLERTAQSIEQNTESRVKIYVGHPSGEEFLVLIVGSFSRDDIAEWANQFRTRIADEPLPSDSEWGKLTSYENLSMITLPPLAERSITASVGVSIHTASVKFSAEDGYSKSLLDRADTALYRAKSAGRNQVILFDDILGSCGRVLEQDRHTRIIAVDIGSSIGVTLGQEFRVYPAGLNGKRKFFMSDGRSKRTIGFYPKVELTRITIFNVQPELSFAFISDINEQSIDIDVGAELEAIPAGSIGRIVPYVSKFLAADLESYNAGDAGELKDFIHREVANNKHPFSITMFFSRDGIYQKKYGSAAVNIARKKLYREALNFFHSESYIRILDKSTLCVAGANSTYKEENILQFVEKISSEFLEIGLTIGVFCNADAEKSPKNYNEKLDEMYSVEFSQFAASEYREVSKNNVCHFSYAMAEHILSKQRDLKLFAEAQADYEKFRGFGLEGPRLCNLGGLIYSAQGKDELAAEQFEISMKRDSSNIIYKTNFATCCVKFGEIDKPLNLLNSVDENKILELKKIHLYGFFVYGVLLAKAKFNKSIEFRLDRLEIFKNNIDALLEFQKSNKAYYDLLVSSF